MMPDDIRAAERAADRLARLLTQFKAAIPRTHIPVVEDDPAAGDPTNIWLMEDGRLRARTAAGTIVEFLPVDQIRPAIPTFTSDPSAGTGWDLWWRGDTGDLKGRMANGTVKTIYGGGTTSTTGGTKGIGSAASATAKPADPKPKTYRDTYNSTWAMSYCSIHGQESGSELHYGNLGSGAHGERRVMVGFNYAGIQSDLSGATVKKIELRMNNTHSDRYAGVRVHWGGHKKNSAPSSFSAVRRDVWSGQWPRSGYGTQWRKINLWFAKAFKNDSIRGLTIDQGSSRVEYGAMDWQSVSIRVTYVK